MRWGIIYVCIFKFYQIFGHNQKYFSSSTQELFSDEAPISGNNQKSGFYKRIHLNENVLLNSKDFEDTPTIENEYKFKLLDDIDTADNETYINENDNSFDNLTYVEDRNTKQDGYNDEDKGLKQSTVGQIIGIEAKPKGGVLYIDDENDMGSDDSYDKVTITTIESSRDTEMLSGLATEYSDYIERFETVLSSFSSKQNKITDADNDESNKFINLILKEINLYTIKTTPSYKKSNIQVTIKSVKTSGDAHDDVKSTAKFIKWHKSNANDEYSEDKDVQTIQKSLIKTVDEKGNDENEIIGKEITWQASNSSNIYQKGKIIDWKLGKFLNGGSNANTETEATEIKTHLTLPDSRNDIMLTMSELDPYYLKRRYNLVPTLTGLHPTITIPRSHLAMPTKTTFNYKIRPTHSKHRNDLVPTVTKPQPTLTKYRKVLSPQNTKSGPSMPKAKPTRTHPRNDFVPTTTRVYPTLSKTRSHLAIPNKTAIDKILHPTHSKPRNDFIPTATNYQPMRYHTLSKTKNHLAIPTKTTIDKILHPTHSKPRNDFVPTVTKPRKLILPTNTKAATNYQPTFTKSEKVLSQKNTKSVPVMSKPQRTSFQPRNDLAPTITKAKPTLSKSKKVMQPSTTQSISTISIPTRTSSQQNVFESTSKSRPTFTKFIKMLEPIYTKSGPSISNPNRTRSQHRNGLMPTVTKPQPTRTKSRKTLIPTNTKCKPQRTYSQPYALVALVPTITEQKLSLTTSDESELAPTITKPQLIRTQNKIILEPTKTKPTIRSQTIEPTKSAPQPTVSNARLFSITKIHPTRTKSRYNSTKPKKSTIEKGRLPPPKYKKIIVNTAKKTYPTLLKSRKVSIASNTKSTPPITIDYSKVTKQMPKSSSTLPESLPTRTHPDNDPVSTATEEIETPIRIQTPTKFQQKPTKTEDINEIKSELIFVPARNLTPTVTQQSTLSLSESIPIPTITKRKLIEPKDINEIKSELVFVPARNLAPTVTQQSTLSLSESIPVTMTKRKLIEPNEIFVWGRSISLTPPIEILITFSPFLTSTGIEAETFETSSEETQDFTTTDDMYVGNTNINTHTDEIYDGSANINTDTDEIYDGSTNNDTDTTKKSDNSEMTEQTFDETNVDFDSQQLTDDTYLSKDLEDRGQMPEIRSERIPESYIKESILNVLGSLIDNKQARHNIIDKFSKGLEGFSISTCLPKPTTTEPPVTLDMSKTSLVSKCYVCGLDTPGIPRSSACADAFATDFFPLASVNTNYKGMIAKFKKYCVYYDTKGMLQIPSQPRRVFGRFTGGCSVRWVDLTGVYTQRSCRNSRRPVLGRHYASKRMAKLEMALKDVSDGCIISPIATLLPMSRGISLYARFHACVCTGHWCNSAKERKQWTTRNAIVLVMVSWFR